MATSGKESMSRRQFIIKTLEAAAGLVVAGCTPSATPVTPGPIETPKPIKITITPVEIKPTIQATQAATVTATAKPANTEEPKNTDNKGLFPNKDAYPIFPEFDLTNSDTSIEGLTNRFDEAIKKGELTENGKKQVLDIVAQNKIYNIWHVFREEWLKDPKNNNIPKTWPEDGVLMAKEMNEYAVKNGYSTIYSWNGKYGNDLQIITTLVRKTQDGKTQMKWNGENGVLYLRPDSYTKGTTQVNWVTVPDLTQPIISWVNGAPIVVSKTFGNTPVSWFNPLIRSTSNTTYAGEWEKVMGKQTIDMFKTLIKDKENLKLVKAENGSPKIVYVSKDANGIEVSQTVFTLNKDGKTISINWLDNSAGDIIPTQLISFEAKNLIWDNNEATLKIKDKEKRYIYNSKLKGWIESNQVIPGGMSEWVIPITDEIVKEMENSGLEAKFKLIPVQPAFKDYVMFQAMMGQKIEKNYDIKTKNGEILSTMLVYSVAYYFDESGKAKAIILPLAHKLKEGKVIVNNCILIFSLGEDNQKWDDMKVKSPEAYESLFRKTSSQKTNVLVPFNVIWPTYDDIMLQTNGGVVFSNYVQKPYINSWKTELGKLLKTGNNSGLQVIIDFKDH